MQDQSIHCERTCIYVDPFELLESPLYSGMISREYCRVPTSSATKGKAKNPSCTQVAFAPASVASQRHVATAALCRALSRQMMRTRCHFHSPFLLPDLSGSQPPCRCVATLRHRWTNGQKGMDCIHPHVDHLAPCHANAPLTLAQCIATCPDLLFKRGSLRLKKHSSRHH